ncbi:unnamed protein product [Trifolium pratense]|uniref:Uncharacterized protein n=1 Tax=Trifolium pratense TaxID=57577 RepID=A0ACB0KR34_TRIPR|nr:unnamed protein product [Trifolium pratense]
MASSINCVYFFIAILCIASALTLGEATYFTYCFGKGPCPNNTPACSDICVKMGYQYGFCNTYTGACCCRGG